MVKRIAIAVFLMFLASCTSVKYDYIKWHPVSQAEVERAAWERGIAPPVRGFAIWGLGRRCEIWASPYDLSTVLHEARHCREGQFHAIAERNSKTSKLPLNTTWEP